MTQPKWSPFRLSDPDRRQNLQRTLDNKDSTREDTPFHDIFRGSLFIPFHIENVLLSLNSKYFYRWELIEVLQDPKSEGVIKISREAKIVTR